MSKPSVLIIVVALFGLGILTNHSSQSAVAESGPAKSIDSGEESTALNFAKQHHSELTSLLRHLKAMDRERYRTAISELYRTSERLTRMQERSPERYQLEIELWKIDSRVRLLVARSAAGMEVETRQQIKDLLLRRNQLRTDLFQIERQRLTQRLQKVDEQLADLESEGDTLAERELERLMRSVRNRPVTRPNTASNKSRVNRKSDNPNQSKQSKTQP